MTTNQQARQMLNKTHQPHRWENPLGHKRTGPRAQIPKHIRLGVFNRDGYRCIMCGHYGHPNTLHLDHIQPWAAWGPDTSDNLRTLCAGCNLDRSNKLIWEDARQILPIAAGCIDCEPNELYDGRHEFGTLAYCIYCGYNSYSQLVDACWLKDCDCR